MRKILPTTDSWDEKHEIFSMQIGTLMHVKEVLKPDNRIKFMTMTSWVFTLFSLASLAIAITAPFDQGAVQANILKMQAPLTESLNDKIFFSSFDARDHSRHVTPGTQMGILGTVYVHAMNEDLKLAGLEPCVKNLVSTPNVSGLELFEGDTKIDMDSDFIVPAKSTKALTIKGNVSEDTVPGNRFQVGICDAPRARTASGQMISLEGIVPVYSDPASVVGHARVTKKEDKK